MQKSTFDARTAIGYLIAARGNSALAAERAQRDYPDSPTPINEAFLLTTVALDPNSTDLLAQQVRVFALLTTLDAFRASHMVYMEKLPNLAPKDAAHTYTSLLEALTGLINPHNLPPAPSQPSSIDMILSALPDDARKAVTFFLQKPPASSAAQAPGSTAPSAPAPFAPFTAEHAALSAARDPSPDPHAARDKPEVFNTVAHDETVYSGGANNSEPEDGEEGEDSEPQLLHEFRSYGG